jgi:hypothetical protein
MKLAELVKNRKESIETEKSAVIRLYRARPTFYWQILKQPIKLA